MKESNYFISKEELTEEQESRVYRRIMEKIIRQYFDCWLKKDIVPLKEIFADNVIYTECYGPEYQGLDQVLRWFREWNEKGTVLKWDIKQVLAQGNILAAEWYFECNYDGAVSGVDGVTRVVFDGDGKIASLKEFESKAQHHHPYDCR